MKQMEIEKNVKKQGYEIRYGTPHRFKAVYTDDNEQALRIYDKAKRFSEKHGLTWIIALWYKGWLEKSETINGEMVTYEELLNR